MTYLPGQVIFNSTEEKLIFQKLTYTGDEAK